MIRTVYEISCYLTGRRKLWMLPLILMLAVMALVTSVSYILIPSVFVYAHF